MVFVLRTSVDDVSKGRKLNTISNPSKDRIVILETTENTRVQASAGVSWEYMVFISSKVLDVVEVVVVR